MKMKTRELVPIKEDAKLVEAMEDELIEFLRREIYLPLIRETHEEPEVLTNAAPDPMLLLVQAIATGRIRYTKGGFDGKFSAQISKALKGLGATWERKQGMWKLPSSKLTVDMRAAIGTSESRYDAMVKRIDKRLGQIAPDEIVKRLSLDDIFDRTIYQANKDLEATTKGLTIKAKFTPEQARLIREQYSENMKLYIQDWTKKEILELRQTVQKQITGGRRYETLVGSIQRSYGVSQSKAKFLARQESNLLVASIRESRYKDAGVTEYRWKCVAGSANHPVRPMHKALGERSAKGETFFWDNPPIVDENGNRKHPGQDYGCRCTAIPIVRF